MRSMQWQLGILGTISAFTYRHRENKKTLCRDGRSQDLPSTDFQPAVRQLKKTQQYTHSKKNTHKLTTTIHTANQQQLHTSNNTHETNQDFICTKGKNSQVRQCCVQTKIRNIILILVKKKLLISTFQLLIILITVKTAYNSTAKDRIIFSIVGRFLLIQALEGRILRIPEP